MVAALENLGWKHYSISHIKKNKDISKYKDNSKTFVTLIGDLSSKDKRTIINAFNDESNIDASKIKVLIADRQYKEGISLLDTNFVHVFEPTMSISDFNQIIARAVRNCSHVRLPYPEKWFVKIFTYFSKKTERIDQSDDLTTDYIVSGIAKSRNYIKQEFLQILKEISIDCVVNKARNENNIKCYTNIKKKNKENNNILNLSKCQKILLYASIQNVYCSKLKDKIMKINGVI